MSINYNITEVTSSSVEIEFEENITEYDEIDLIVILDGVEILLDSYFKETDASDYMVIRPIKENILKIDVNMVQLDFLYYKDFKLVFYKDNKETQKVTATFNISPVGKTNLYGVINKMEHDFNKLWTLSGTTCVFFVKSHAFIYCDKCYDPDLKQIVNTSCEVCNGTGKLMPYTPVEFKARKTKTDTTQYVDDKGVRIINTSTFVTFNRLNFTLGSFFYDKTTRDFFEIKDAHKASIGGIKTSTTIIGEQLATNDVRVAPLLETLKNHSLL